MVLKTRSCSLFTVASRSSPRAAIALYAVLGLRAGEVRKSSSRLPRERS